MYNIYYAHHQWKYGTKIEEYEIKLIKKYFPDYHICNPATDLITDPALGEKTIMEECLNRVRDCDILIFSSMDGVIGTGVFHEVEEARREGKFIYYIFHNRFYSCFNIVEFDNDKKTDRLYAMVNIGLY